MVGTNDMIEITARVLDWLRRHNIDPEGVKLVLEMPDQFAVYAADRAVNLDLRPHQLTDIDLSGGRDPQKMNGIGLEFRYARKS